MSGLEKQIIRKSKDLQIQAFFPQKYLLVQGVGGVVKYPMLYEVSYEKKTNKICFLSTESKIKQKKAFYILNQILLTQACLGVLFSYRKQLNIVGIGYQALVEKDVNLFFLILKLGFSHQIRFLVPQLLEISCPKPRVILIKGMSLQKVTNCAALIRSLKLPNSYKEKGIYRDGEKLQLKQGKKT
jgi:large subunit ribosomal protein L6